MAELGILAIGLFVCFEIPIGIWRVVPAAFLLLLIGMIVLYIAND